MTDRPDRATSDQADLLARLMESHHFTDAEKGAVRVEMFGAYPMTKERASKLIDAALKAINERRAAEKAAEKAATTGAT